MPILSGERFQAALQALLRRFGSLAVRTDSVGVLKNDGAGNLSWGPESGGPGGAGTMGPPGVDGAEGEPGQPGPPGPQGAAGAAGSTGAAGPAGLPIFLVGDTLEGDQGPPGVPGAAGAAGSAGATGGQGPVGPPIFLLEDAADGEPGPPGPAGAAGAAGSNGATGAQGPTGPPIFLLEEAVDGEPGPPGQTGATGATGPNPLTKGTGTTVACGADETWLVLTNDSGNITGTGLTTVMTITGVGTGRYTFKCMLLYQTTATTTGIDTAVDHTGTTTNWIVEARFASTGGAAATAAASEAAASATGNLYEAQGNRTKNTAIGAGTVSVDAANNIMLITLEGAFIVTASGTLNIKLAAEAAGLVCTARAGSTLVLRKFST